MHTGGVRIQTLSILFADLKGYTERQARSSRDDITRDLATFGELVLPVLAAFGGEVVKAMGDAFLACFESPTNAVLAAVQVQKQLEGHNRSLAEPSRALHVRIGIATGEIHRDPKGDVFGDPVNLAARLQTSAEPGAVWLAETTFLAMNKNEVAAFEVGARVFKGIPGEVKVYRVLEDFITAARTLSRQELHAARGTQAPANPPTATRRGWLVALLALAGIAGAVVFARRSDPRPALARYEADPTDLASADEHARLVLRELYAAEAEGRMPAIYREGTVRDWLQQQQARLQEREPFQRLQVVYLMANEPLGDGVAELVAQRVTQHADWAGDAGFVALLRATCDYAAKDPARQTVYATALRTLGG